MRDHDADRLRFARAGVIESHGVKAFIKASATVPTSGRVQEVLLDNSRDLIVGDLVAKVEDFGEVIDPQIFRIATIEPDAGGNPLRWFTLDRQS